MTENTEVLLHIGSSTQTLETAAVNEAIANAMKEYALSNDSKPCRFALVFATDQYHPEKVAYAINTRLKEISREIQWAGCTSAGVFAGTHFIQNGIVVGILTGIQLEVGVGVSELSLPTSRQAGIDATRQALSQSTDPNKMKNFIVLANSKFSNVDEVIRGAVKEAGMMHLWAGGGVGNIRQDTFPSAFAFGKAYDQHVIIISLNIPNSITIGVSHGWRPYGPPMMVTRASGTTTLEFEYQEAFEVYRQTAAEKGEHIREADFQSFATTHPLGIPQADGTYIIRDPIGLGPNGSLNFFAEVPDGSLVRVMEGSSTALLQAARNAAEFAKNQSSKNLHGAFIFDCISRFNILAQDYTLELKEFQYSLGQDIPVFGCLTVGEIGSFGKGVPQFHNKTAVVVALH